MPLVRILPRNPILKNMLSFKKIIWLFSLLAVLNVGLIVATTAPVMAAGDYGLTEAGTVSGLSKTKISTGYNGDTAIAALIGDIVGVFLSLLGIVFFGLALYSGINWMIARGDTGKVDKAKDTLESAIIGLVIVVSAYAIANFVFANLVNVKPAAPAAPAAPVEEEASVAPPAAP